MSRQKLNGLFQLAREMRKAGAISSSEYQRIEARKRMVRYWINKGFSEKIVNIFYGSRTPEQHEIIINCRNTEEALKKLSEKIGG